MVSTKEPIFFFDNTDPVMQQANERARETFKFFWRELPWERRRIIPGLDLACVKLPFSDDESFSETLKADDVEQMWLQDVDFDGKNICGRLLNSPNWLKSVKADDFVSMPFGMMSDWMYSCRGDVFGAYTVNAIRAKMSISERKSHDNAWGLDFGDPKVIRVAYTSEGPKPKKWFLFGKKSDTKNYITYEERHRTDEHPMSDNMGPSLNDTLNNDPSLIDYADENGFTFLHQLAMAGSFAGVKVLIDHGVDKEKLTNNGLSAKELAKFFHWDKVISLLS
ncbi:MAG: DUF2314 domain-containing protein [Lentisphaeraceae bacterium]|nr:DUF2314 domain-containing protein [Lentisphaeraceae bacterium]